MHNSDLGPLTNVSDLSSLLDTPHIDADQKSNKHGRSQNRRNDEADSHLTHLTPLTLLRVSFMEGQKQCQWRIRNVSYSIQLLYSRFNRVHTSSIYDNLRSI